MAESAKNKYRRVYEELISWPVSDRLALIQMLAATVRLDLSLDGGETGQGGGEAASENGQQSGPPDDVPRGVPVDRILARTVPRFIDDAAIDQMRWEHLSEKYLK